MDSLPPGGQHIPPGLLPPGGEYIPAGKSCPPPWKLVKIESILLGWQQQLTHLDMHITSHSFIDRVGGGQPVPAGLSCPPPQCLVEYFLLFLLSTRIYFCSIIMVSNNKKLL